MATPRDAAETLDGVCLDGDPRTDLLRRRLGPVLDHLAGCFGELHAYGEMVDPSSSRACSR